MSIIKSVCLLLFLSLLSPLYSQNHFYSIYTGNGYDFGEGVFQSKKDSSYYITGSSSSFSDAPSQAFVMHVDTGGTYLWSKSYGGNASDIGKRIFSIPNDGIYVAGFSSSFSNGLFDFYFFKTDTNGVLLWEKTYGGSSNEILHDALVLPDTSFILVGQTTSNPNEIEDVFITRISNKGEVLWEKTLGSNGVDIAKSISMIDLNHIVIGGEYYDSDSSKQKALLFSINQLGDIQWLKTYGTKKSNYYITDVYADSSYIRAVGYAKISETNDKVYYNMTTDTLGFHYYENYIPQSGSNYYSQIIQYGSFKYHYLAMQPTNNSIIPTYSGGEDLQICRYKNDLTWHPKCVNPSNQGDDHCNQLISTSDGGALSVGYNVYGGKGGSNVTILKIGPYDQFPSGSEAPIEHTIVGIEEIKNFYKFSIYPNPASSEISIVVNTNEALKIEILTLNGEVLEEKWMNGKTIINLTNFEKGLYFVRIGGITKKISVI
jgi:hypothetical protein